MEKDKPDVQVVFSRDPRPKKSLGQHFLKDRSAARRIVELLRPDRDDWIVEVGPGSGALSVHLAEALGPGGRLILVETDRSLAARLSETYRSRPEIAVLEGDARKTDYRALLAGAPGKAKAVGNLPYNAAAPILFRLLEQSDLFSRWVVMLQREVAERLAAPPGGKARGILSVLFGMRADVEIVMRLKPGAFHPPPKVESAVVDFSILDESRYALGEAALFKSLVKKAFSARRKTLRNSLARGKGAPFGEQGILEALRDAGIDPGRRAESLTLTEWAALSWRLSTSR